MKIKTLTGAVEYSDVQIQHRTHQLFFILTGGAGAISTPEMRLSLIGGPKGSETLWPDMSILDMAEYSQYGEGMQRRDPSAKTFHMFIDVGQDGSLDLNNSRYLSLDVSEIAADETLEIYAVPTPESTNIAVKFGQWTMQAEERSKRFPLVNVDSLLIDRTGSFERLTLNYPDSPSITYLVEEIAMISGQGNDISFYDTDSGTVATDFGAVNYFLNVEDAESVEFENPSGAANDTEIIYVRRVAV